MDAVQASNRWKAPNARDASASSSFVINLGYFGRFEVVVQLKDSALRWRMDGTSSLSEQFPSQRDLPPHNQGTSICRLPNEPKIRDRISVASSRSLLPAKTMQKYNQVKSQEIYCSRDFAHFAQSPGAPACDEHQQVSLPPAIFDMSFKTSFPSTISCVLASRIR